MKYLVKNKAWRLTKEYNLDKLLYLLIDRPDKITNRNSTVFAWTNNNNQEHRDYDFPACIIDPHSYFFSYDGIFWEKNNRFCRDNNNPAIIWTDGSKDYYINNKWVKTENLL